jgi:hypothetical protein
MQPCFRVMLFVSQEHRIIWEIRTGKNAPFYASTQAPGICINNFSPTRVDYRNP